MWALLSSLWTHFRLVLYYSAHYNPMKRFLEYASLAVLCLSAVLLIALQAKTSGWVLLGLGALLLLGCAKQFAKDLLLVYVTVGILGLTPITTDISYGHMAKMGLALALAVTLPYVVSRYLYRDYLVRFTFRHGRNWYKTEFLYILATVALAYFLLPFYLRQTNAYLNWSVQPGVSNIVRLFIGTNALGIWDELFFVSTVLGILRRYIPFGWANFAQSIFFTSFLYELGFTGWGWAMIFGFALSQGYIFKKTESLFYVITIHLALDLVLFLALIHAHHPWWLPIFFT